MKKYFPNVIGFGGLFMGIVFYLLCKKIYRNIYFERGLCRLDYGVFIMKPLHYTLLMMFPLLFTVYLMHRHEFSYSFVIRCGSWRQLLSRQIKTNMISSFFYAAFFVGFIFLADRKIPFYNWNIQGSYYFSQNHFILSLPAAEVVCYLFLICGVRNFIIEGILLFSLWNHSFLQGIGCICGISCFEIAQQKYKIFYRLISFDYTLWANQNERLELLLAVFFYIFIGYLLFRSCINKKEIIKIE
ncbi:MAG: hypothetical protein OSJ62_15010 [Lachnospiraceae bacterium]|nr:hypothetical protein [Lachnospiraceae bacterium]